MPKKGKGRSGMSAKRGKDVYCMELVIYDVHRRVTQCFCYLRIYTNCVIINQYIICCKQSTYVRHFFCTLFCRELKACSLRCIEFSGEKIEFWKQEYQFFPHREFFCNFLVKKNLHKVEFWDKIWLSFFLGPHFLSFFHG